MAVVFLGYLSFNDYEKTLWLSQNSVDGFTTFMNQSLFQKGGFGASDIPVFFDILALIALFSIGPAKAVKHRDLRIGLYFLITSQLLLAVLVHSLKISWGRARPYLVFSGEMDFAPWYDIGANHFIGDGRFSGAFPSGHSVMMMTLFSFYLFFSNVDAMKRNKLLARFFFYSRMYWLSCYGNFEVYVSTALAHGFSRFIYFGWKFSCVLF